MWKKLYNSREFDRILSIISIIVTLILVENYSIVFARFGMEKMQFKVADEARINCDFSTALEYYDMIIKENDTNAPYAALAELEIYTQYYNSIADVDEVINDFIIASRSDDVLVLKSCFYFLITQFDLNMSDDKYRSKLLSAENIEYIVRLFNKIYSLDEDLFKDTGINFPVDKADINAILSKNAKKTMDEWHWEYVSTIVSEKSYLSTETENEKVMLVSVEDHPVCIASFDSIKVYKYWRYKKVIDKKNNSIPILNILLQKEYAVNPIYFSKMKQS